MNYLELCQRTRQECGISGNGPASVENQTGEMKRVVDWVNTAWLDIQRDRADWTFMRAVALFDTVPGQAIYTPADMGIEPYSVAGLVQPVIGVGALPDGRVLLTPTPTEVQAVTLLYYREPMPFSGNLDIPSLPQQWHMSIVYRAMLLYAAYESASDVYQTAQAEYQTMYAKMLRDCLPRLEKPTCQLA